MTKISGVIDTEVRNSLSTERRTRLEDGIQIVVVNKPLKTIYT